MSDHFDTEDSRTDITDLYVSPSPQGGDRSVLILDINPDASALEVSFDPAASYELKIDTDGDAPPEDKDLTRRRTPTTLGRHGDPEEELRESR